MISNHLKLSYLTNKVRAGVERGIQSAKRALETAQKQEAQKVLSKKIGVRSAKGEAPAYQSGDLFRSVFIRARTQGFKVRLDFNSVFYGGILDNNPKWNRPWKKRSGENLRKRLAHILRPLIVDGLKAEIGGN